MNTRKEETDSKFAKVEHKLKDLDNGLQERNRHFESVCNIYNIES